MSPPALRWVESCARALARANDQLTGWEVLPDGGDPLRWHICISQKKKKWEEPFRSITRDVVRRWAEANDCVYQRTDYEKNVMKVRILIKYPSRPSDKEPY